MLVYIVVDEENMIQGVFSSWEKAQKYVDEHKKVNYHYWSEILEEQVDLNEV